MDTILNWIGNNKEWFFSGLGVFLLGLIITIITKVNYKIKNNQKIGNNSQGIQVGGDFIIGGGKSDGSKNRK